VCTAAVSTFYVLRSALTSPEDSGALVFTQLYFKFHSG
jgi:hypothetical protein